MKILSPSEYHELLSSLIPKLHRSWSAEDEKNILISEIYVLATIGTNYQEHIIVDYINTLQRSIQCKCESLPTKNT